MTIDEHDEQMAQSVRHIRAVAEPFLVEQFGARCAVRGKLTALSGEQR